MLECLSIPSRYELTSWTYVSFGTADNPPTGIFPTRGPSAAQPLYPWKLLIRWSLFWSIPARRHTRKVQSENHNGTANLPVNKKKISKCSNDSLCLMTAPPIGRQRAQRNTTKRIKHSMPIFTSISVNKNNSFYNSEGQKNIALDKI